MKHTNIGTLPRTCAAWLMVAAAPFAGAQSPSRPAGAPSPATAPGADAAPTPSPAQAGYLFGLTYGEQLHSVGVTDQVAIDDIVRGMKDGLQGKKSTPADRKQVQEFVRSAMTAAIAHNQAAAKDFLARNGREKGVTTTASGLEYKIIAAGDRKAPAITPTDTVTVQYRGKLLDGTEFDSSYARGAPTPFTVGGVIRGWQEALVLMKPGAKWQLFVPPELAYGPNPRPGIPGGSLLIFDVELLSAKSTNAPTAPGSPTPTQR